MFIICLLGLSSCASDEAETLAVNEQAYTHQKSQEVMVMTEKLSFIKESRVKVDALEKQGFPRVAADRIRLALEQKKRQLMRKTAHLVSAL